MGNSKACRGSVPRRRAISPGGPRRFRACLRRQPGVRGRKRAVEPARRLEADIGAVGQPRHTPRRSRKIDRTGGPARAGSVPRGPPPVLKIRLTFAIWAEGVSRRRRPILRFPMGSLLSSESSVNSDAPAGQDWRWGVFGNLAFTVVLIASSASNVGFAMFDTSSNWLMTSLNPDPMMVSAVQVATTLPMFLLTLPAGALTDIIDARRLLDRRAARRDRDIDRLRGACHLALGDAAGAAGDDVLSRRRPARSPRRHGSSSRRCWCRSRISTAPSPSTTRATTSVARSARPLAGWRSRPSASRCRSGVFASAIWRSWPRFSGGALRARPSSPCRPSAFSARCAPGCATPETTATSIRRSSAPSPFSRSRAPIGRCCRWSRARRCTTARRSTASFSA